ncbi:hypothetical protein AFL22_06630 [Pantoea sp. CFSAN033090]|nr:hypothetical protein AFL22_06630 [Pantoea sp. CFSAN033090]
MDFNVRSVPGVEVVNLNLFLLTEQVIRRRLQLLFVLLYWSQRHAIVCLNRWFNFSFSHLAPSPGFSALAACD